MFLRMAGYYPGSTPLKPQRLVGDARARLIPADEAPATAEWLASINLSGQDTWSYPLKTLPRLTGKSTHVIITEYDLPNKLIEPHDVVLDHEGNVWYSDFGQMFIGEMDPKTGAVTQYPIPVTKPGYSLGTLDLEIDKDDNPWVGVMYQSAIAKFDRKTEKFETWSTPKEWDTDAGQLGHLAIRARPPTTRCGSRIPTAATSTGSIWLQQDGELGASRIRDRQAHRHLRHPLGRREQSLSARFSPAISSRSTPRPRSRRSI